MPILFFIFKKEKEKEKRKICSKYKPLFHFAPLSENKPSCQNSSSSSDMRNWRGRRPQIIFPFHPHSLLSLPCPKPRSNIGNSHYFCFWIPKIYLSTLNISGISSVWISFISLWHCKLNLDWKVWFALGGCCNFLWISDKLISSILVIIQFIKLFIVIFGSFLLWMGNQKRKSMEIEEEFELINDGNGEDVGLEFPLGFFFFELPISGYPD